MPGARLGSRPGEWPSYRPAPLVLSHPRARYLHLDERVRRGVLEVDLDCTSRGVFAHVVQSFLHNAKDRQLRSLGQASQLGVQTGLELLYSRYFMFLLSPLLYLSRLKRVDLGRMKPEAVAELLRRTHKTPIAPINQTLRFVFALETPMGLWFPFPWGTSILGVFRKPD